MEHGLPKSFVKIRHYGLLGNRHREERLAVTVQTVAATVAGTSSSSPVKPAAVATCPHCGSHRLVRCAIASEAEEARGSEPVGVADSS